MWLALWLCRTANKRKRLKIVCMMSWGLWGLISSTSFLPPKFRISEEIDQEESGGWRLKVSLIHVV